MSTSQDPLFLTTPTGILSRVIRPEENNLPQAAAEGLLRLRFEQGDLDRLHDLAEKSQAGELRPEEREEMESYRQIGYLLDLLHSKARLALKPPRAVH